MPPIDPRAVERAVAQFLRALGHEPVGELAETPALVAQAWCEELLDGYRVEPEALLRDNAVTLDGAPAALVALHELRVTTVCPHHLLPATGVATVVYQPTDRVAGFGAIVRALDAVTHRLAFQEHAAAAMANALVAALGARGAACRLRLVHGCLSARGPRQADASVETVSFAGSFAEPGADRAAVLTVLGGGTVERGQAEQRAGAACAATSSPGAACASDSDDGCGRGGIDGGR
jgi:GTP cyclohydrolase I